MRQRRHWYHSPAQRQAILGSDWTMSPGSAVWTPADLSAGILVGHEARDTANLFTDAGTTPVATDGDAVYQWDERHGTAGSFLQTTLSQRPTWQEDYFGSGLHAVLFDGTDDLMQISTASETQTYQVWVAGKLVTDGSRRFLSGNSASSPILQGGSGSQWQAYAGTFIGGAGRDTNNHVWRFDANGASSVLAVDGSSIASGDAGTDAVGGGLTIGANRTGSLPANFAFAAIYLIDAILTGDDATNMESYLQGLLS